MKHIFRASLWKRLIPLVILFLSTSGRAEDALFRIELIPTIVWQGQSINSAMISQVGDFHSLFPRLRIVHAINPRLLMNGAGDVTKLQQSFGSMLNPDDGIAMHLSRLREWMVFARIAPSSGDNLYGIVSDNCDELCGMDQSLVGMSAHELSGMITIGMVEMNRAGFGKPRVVVVEQGTLPEPMWAILAESGLKADWSGFNLDLVADRLRGFPLFAMNDSSRATVSGIKGDAAYSRGRSLDHMRFGVWLEAADLTKIDKITEAAIALAKSNGRSVKLPLFVNASTLVHYGALLKSGVSQVYETVGRARGMVIPWSGEDNSNWDVKKLAAYAHRPSVAKGLNSPGPIGEDSETIATSTATTSTTKVNHAKADIAEPTAEVPIQAQVQSEVIPPESTDETPEILKSHSREMSH